MRTVLVVALVLAAALPGCTGDAPDFEGILVIPPGETSSFVIQTEESGQVVWATTVDGNATCRFFDEGAPAPDMPCRSGNLNWVPTTIEIRWDNPGPAVAVIKYEVWTKGQVFP